MNITSQFALTTTAQRVLLIDISKLHNANIKADVDWLMTFDEGDSSGYLVYAGTSVEFSWEMFRPGCGSQLVSVYARTVAGTGTAYVSRLDVV